MYIYVLTNTVNNKSYVGQSVHDPRTSKGRIRRHFGLLSKNCCAIHNAIKKYGKDAFDTEVIHYLGASQESLDAIEKWKIQQHNSLSPHGYNLRDGGNGGGTHSEETKRKLSKANSGSNSPFYGKPISEETKRKISQSNTGKVRSSETRKLIADIQRGKKRGPHSLEHRRKLSEAHTGKVLSLETRRKLSDIQKGKTLSPEHRRKLSESNTRYWKGKKFSKEYRDKLSEAHKHPVWKSAEQVISMFQQGVSIRQIAKHFDCSTTPITNILKANGLLRVH